MTRYKLSGYCQCYCYYTK